MWRAGFCPGSHPGDCIIGTAATFEAVPAVVLAKRTLARFQAWRDQCDWANSGCRRIAEIT
jgi:hypothetical protein